MNRSRQLSGSRYNSLNDDSSEAILAIRTYAFLGKKLWVGILVIAMLLGETAYLLYVAIAGVYQIPPVIGDKGPCTASDKPGQHVVSGFWLAPVAFDLICTGLTIGKVASLLACQEQRVQLIVFLGLLPPWCRRPIKHRRCICTRGHFLLHRCGRC